MLKYSKQREAIKEFMMTRKDHPTADVVYTNIKEQFPNISLGTVYRNLQLLTDIGELQKIRVGDGLDHFDADTSFHYHFACNGCGAVMDLDIDTSNAEHINRIAGEKFEGMITGHVVTFTGLCPNCITKS